MSDQLQLWPQPRPADPVRWSFSRDKRLRDCSRKYYYYHYASLGGQRAEPQSIARELYILKNLRNRYMWVGEVVHELIELALQRWKRNQEVDLESLIERGTRRMRADYAESVQGVYRDRPAQACGLIEHEYAEATSRAEWQAMRDRMERCLRNFFALPLTQHIRRMPPWRWMALESLGSFTLDGATIIVKPDFAWRDDDGRLVLVDWKTGGQSPDERLQLAVYGIFAQRQWGFSSDALRAQLVYLDSGHVEAFDLPAASLEQAEQQVLTSVAHMRALGHKEIPDAADFPVTDVMQVCSRCAFRRICRP